MEEFERIDSEIRQLLQQVKEKRKEMIRAKLQHLQENGISQISELTEEENEILASFLVENGDFNSVIVQHEWHYAYYPEDQGNNYESTNCYLMIGDEIYSTINNEFIDIDQIEDDFRSDEDYGRDDDGRETLIGSKKLLTVPLNIEQLFDVKVAEIDEVPETTINEKDLEDYMYSLVYDTESHTVIDFSEMNSEEIDEMQDLPELYYIIYHILRSEILDIRANAMFGEKNNYCAIGRYSDMPGEEEIAIILNSIDKKALDTYFKLNPEDMTLFEEMRGKYGNIQSLDEDFQITDEEKEHGDKKGKRGDFEEGKDTFLTNIVGHATKRVELREKDAEAKKLVQDYEGQLPKPPSLGED